MDSSEFIKKCKQAVAKYVKEYSYYVNKDLSELNKTSDIFVVQSTKVLGNNKAVLATKLSDNVFYECTYNGDTHELHVNAYQKKYYNGGLNFEVVG